MFCVFSSATTVAVVIHILFLLYHQRFMYFVDVPYNTIRVVCKKNKKYHFTTLHLF